MSKYVFFPEFRDHDSTRIEVNSAIMGLLAGSHMAAHLLKLTEGSDHLLAEVFPRIPHIKRFNLTTSVANGILQSAESHLGAMAVPYVLGAHEDYMKACLRLVEKHTSVNLGANNVKSANQHEKLQDNSASKFSADTLDQFHLVRKMRNCTIHAGGLADRRLQNHCNNMGAGARAGWERLAGYAPSFQDGQDFVKLGHRETVAALAITKNLARQANAILQVCIPRPAWGEILMKDLDEVGPGLPKDPAERLRKVRGYARFRYSALRFTEQEIVSFNSAY
ncbi:hypothetical protein GCM10010129_48150 [Streptomyces fumigatiscleroticus]|nr:hypothetical protein GCM10010129_48150 [Streptomyces fumigatiscleroticus]